MLYLVMDSQLYLRILKLAEAPEVIPLVTPEGIPTVPPTVPPTVTPTTPSLLDRGINALPPALQDQLLNKQENIPPDVFEVFKALGFPGLAPIYPAIKKINDYQGRSWIDKALVPAYLGLKLSPNEAESVHKAIHFYPKSELVEKIPNVLNAFTHSPQAQVLAAGLGTLGVVKLLPKNDKNRKKLETAAKVIAAVDLGLVGANIAMATGTDIRDITKGIQAPGGSFFGYLKDSEKLFDAATPTNAAFSAIQGLGRPITAAGVALSKLLETPKERPPVLNDTEISNMIDTLKNSLMKKQGNLNLNHLNPVQLAALGATVGGTFGALTSDKNKKIKGALKGMGVGGALAGAASLINEFDRNQTNTRLGAAIVAKEIKDSIAGRPTFSDITDPQKKLQDPEKIKVIKDFFKKTQGNSPIPSDILNKIIKKLIAT